MFKRILCATDLSPLSDEALRMAVHMATKYDAKLTVLNVHEEFMDKKEMVMLRVSVEEMQKRFIKIAVRAKAEMRQLVTAVGVDDIKVKYVLRKGKPGEMIVIVAKELKKGLRAENELLVIMGTHGHPDLLKRFIGRTADYVMRNASSPVMVIPFVKV